jgi:hypothetical protein
MVSMGTELGQPSAHLSSDGAIESTAEVVVQEGQVSDLHRSRTRHRLFMHMDGLPSPLHHPDLVRKSAHRERQNPRSAPREVAQRRKVAQLGYKPWSAWVEALPAGIGVYRCGNAEGRRFEKVCDENGASVVPVASLSPVWYHGATAACCLTLSRGHD